MSAAYDLRSNAKTSGNRAYLPPQYKVVMHVYYAAIVFSVLAIAGYSAWGVMLKWKIDEVNANLNRVKQSIDTQDRMLWLADWRSQSIPMQEMLVDFFTDLPTDERLSQLIVKHNGDDGTVDLTIAINSDRNTSSQYFREMKTFFQKKWGLANQQYDSTPAVGATVFKGKYRIMRHYNSPLAKPQTAAKPAPAPKVQPEQAPSEDSSAEQSK
jgi:hypothetical protein